MLPSRWRYRRFHVSFVLAWLALGLLLGLFLGQFCHLSATLPLAILSLLGIGWSLRSKRWFACVAIVIAGGLLGLLRGSWFSGDLLRLNQYVRHEIGLVGTISQDPVLKNGSDLWQVQLTQIEVAQHDCNGEVYATVVTDKVLKRGDRVSLEGRSQEGFGNFRLSLYRAEMKSLQRPNDPFLAARDSFAESVRRVMPEPESSLGLGFLVGEKASLPVDLTEQMKTVGLTHIIVASGYNLTILVRFARRRLARSSRYLALAGSVMLVIGFVLVSGFSPSMNRAAIVTILSLLAWYYGRKFHPVKLILYVASTSAFIYPVYIWSDLGWLLSFAAFTGVLVVSPILTKILYRHRKEPGDLVRLVLETLSAEVMTLPIIIAAFGYVPTLALLANVLVAPVIPFAMFAVFIAGLVGYLPAVLSVVALPSSMIVAYVIAVVEWLSAPEWARVVLRVPSAIMYTWYILLGGFMFLAWRRRRVDLMSTSVVE